MVRRLTKSYLAAIIPIDDCGRKTSLRRHLKRPQQGEADFVGAFAGQDHVPFAGREPIIGRRNGNVHRVLIFDHVLIAQYFLGSGPHEMDVRAGLADQGVGLAMARQR